MHASRFGTAIVIASVVLSLLVIALASGAGRAGQDDSRPFTESSLPTGWSIQKDVAVPKAQLAGFESRLGGRVASLVNQVVSIHGFPVRVNAIVGVSEKDAEAIEKTMLAIRGSAYVARRDRTVYEVAGENTLVARRVLAALDLGQGETVEWDVAFRIALIDDLDYTAGNRVFNHFLALEKDPTNAAAKAAIRSETKGWTFGRTLRLVPSDAGTPWRFDPKPVATRQEGLVTVYEFDDPPRFEGVPYVDVRGRITTTPRFAPGGASSGDAEALRRSVQATPFWPVEADEVQALVQGTGTAGDDARVQALQRIVNERVRYGGAVGTRDGTLAVLERGYGRCWDKADVLVTLARAAGLPARQVAGWVPPLGAGHIWTEIHVAGGWLPVDATTSWLGVSSDYLPFFRTEDGVMPVVYLRMPLLSRRD